YNICIGNQLRGGPGPTNGGRYDRAFQARFTSAAKSCSVRGGRSRLPTFVGVPAAAPRRGRGRPAGT
ncbi:hypothetical protein LCGC14_2846220, partial [marine sediment metagenome]